ncbi:two-component sensor histidine kinase [Shewanella gelidii]|uniref:histidine kinase n=1 Tax=Shewanella gelidii TaxID=1642821 RepID=A0A917NED7_9GAMM|nr:HAMP domain-containing sensor histidine kinase [Shewanella gelidii]GGI89733.1 two-component sensor histidine kinase [Shewanella gelidii]
MVTVIISVLLLVMYRQLITEQEIQIAQHIEAEVTRYQNLARVHDRLGFAKQVSAAAGQAVFVSWHNGAHVLGAMSYIPEDLPIYPQTKEFMVFAGGSHKLFVLTGGIAQTQMGPVLIATRSDHLVTVFDEFIGASITAITMTLLLTLTLGWLFSKAILRRIQRYQELSALIEHGDYGIRFPIGGRRDEFDVVAKQFNQVLDTLESNLAAVRGVTDNIAHDLRTPLSHLRMGLERLQTLPSDQVADASAGLIEELEHCLATFDSMLSLTRIEGGQRPLEREPVSLHELCQDLQEMAEAMAEAKSQSLQINLGLDRTISGDKHLLFQALFNLVDNAITYAGTESTIVIEQHEGMICIRDNGPGIPEDCRERVFERLVRLDPSRQHKGTGLGLSMVKAILSRHNATITLKDNQPGLIAVVEFEC